MFITTQNEILAVMPTARWDKPQQLFGWIEEEERVALEPLLGTPLYEHLCREYERLMDTYQDITATTVRPTGRAKVDARLAHADVTERLELIRQGKYRETYVAPEDGDKDVDDKDMMTIRLIRICQQIEFYRMLAHKAGLLSVSFNEGGGMNVITADGYDGTDDKAKERVVKDAFMSAGRATDTLLLFLEGDAKGGRLFTELWQEADAFYLHRDLLFQTARMLNEYLDIKGERMAYVQLVRDIRFCQNTYLKPRIGAKLMKAVVDYVNRGTAEQEEQEPDYEVFEELAGLLRTALAFYVESRRTGIINISPLSGSNSRSGTGSYQKEDRLARRDSMTDAQQAMAMACQYVEDNLDALGKAAVGSPIYNAVQARKEQEAMEAQDADAARRRMCRERMEQNRKKLFTAFPATHIRPERK
jgi:hypothetical protein